MSRKNKIKRPGPLPMHPRMAMALGLAPDTRNSRERFDDEMELAAMAVKYGWAR